MTPLSLGRPKSAHNPLQPFIRDFERLLGPRAVLHRPEALMTYRYDACTLVQADPHLVVLPKTTAQVAAVVRLCRQHGIPYVARGAGTGLSGGAVPLVGGVIIGLNRMDRIIEIDAVRQTATVEVGVVNARLTAAVAPRGLFYGPDPSSQAACTLGGNVAENAGGIHCIKVGVTVDHVLGLEVVLPNGEVLRLGGKTRRSRDANLIGLLVGSEGTLGIVTEVTVRLLPQPKQARVVLAAFPKLAQATDTVQAIIAGGLLPAALECMDAFTIRAVNAAYGVGFPEDSEAVLLVELTGSAAQLAVDEPTLQTLLARHGASQVRTAETAEDRQRLWAARKGAVAAYGRLQPAFYLHDCVIPRSALTDVIQKIQAIAAAHDVPVGNVFHAGDGNLHPNLLYDPADPAMVRRVLAAGDAIIQVCLDAGGTLTGEHGVGLEKSAFMSRLFSPADLARMQQVKAVFDPVGLANPEKIFPSPRGCGEVGLGHTPAAVQDGTLWV